MYGMMNMSDDKSKGHNEKADSKYYHPTALLTILIVWSFGMVLFEMLTLDIPYRAEGYPRFEIPDLVEKGIRPTFPPNITFEAAFQPLIKVFQICTEKEPSKRLNSKDLCKKIRRLYVAATGGALMNPKELNVATSIANLFTQNRKNSVGSPRPY